MLLSGYHNMLFLTSQRLSLHSEVLIGYYLTLKEINTFQKLESLSLYNLTAVGNVTIIIVIIIIINVHLT